MWSPARICASSAKGNKERIVPLSRKTQEILARYLAAGGGRALLAEKAKGRAGKICAAVEPHGARD